MPPMVTIIAVWVNQMMFATARPSAFPKPRLKPDMTAHCRNQRLPERG